MFTVVSQALTRDISAVPEVLGSDLDEEHPTALNSDGGIVADVHTGSEPSNTSPKQQSQRQSSGGRGTRRSLDGGPAGPGGGLRGSARGQGFVDSGKQGKPLHDQVDMTTAVEPHSLDLILPPL